MNSLDLGWKNGALGRRLSNLYPYPFELDEVQCGSIEGFLQALKHEDEEAQRVMAAEHGFVAYKVGQMGNGWVDTQTLWWKGVTYPRLSPEYHQLLERAYDACFDQNKAFREALFETGIDVLTHVIGRHDPTRTTLTEWEYIYNMYRLRAKAQQQDLLG